MINKKKGTRLEGRLLEVLDKSPLEVREPVCSIFPTCGGCMYQTMSYEEQLNMKAAQVKKLIDEAVIRGGQVDTEGKPGYIFEGIKGSPQELELPSAPKQFIRYMEEADRPQVQADVDYENGMGVSVGRLREDKVYDFKFIGLSHNTVRGAAGGAVLCAETLKAKGYITKK